MRGALETLSIGSRNPKVGSRDLKKPLAVDLGVLQKPSALGTNPETLIYKGPGVSKK